ncbi:RidA family protein [Neobacillus cucumis]|uniref:RidA family protein n=1 Tax=Neobacillus cucumis TaxID=1740721 RepID=UPI0018E0619A|nr:RidA family protein [Neobacillus cucumis]MBI0579876.1 RidA family protein [Neobacillus cucumis]
MEVIKGNLPNLGPLSVAVKKNQMFYTSVIPVYRDGSFETGDFTKQAELAFGNLQILAEDAGGSLRDIVQVTVYLTDIHDTPKMNEVWKEFFQDPYPNRATLGISSLTVPDLKIELVATAIIEQD